MEKLKQKTEKLKHIISQHHEAAIAFSGGVSSTVLLKLAKELLKNCVAITVNSALLPTYALKQSKQIAKDLGVKQIILDMPVSKKMINSKTKCYFCKREQMNLIRKEAMKQGMHFVLDASIDTDEQVQKALHEFSIHSPLQEAEMTKQDILHLANLLHIEVRGKPHVCLAHRINDEITHDNLHKLNKADSFLKDTGIHHSSIVIDSGKGIVQVNHKDIQDFVVNSRKIRKGMRKIGLQTRFELEKVYK